MSATETFLATLKEVVFLPQRVNGIEKMLDRRLIRIETLVEFSQYKPLPA